jgi:hypothetical protein
MMQNTKGSTPILFSTLSVLHILLLLNCLRLFYQNAPDVLSSSCDTGWLIRTGEYILQNWSIPTHDIFTWTNQSQPFVAYQWLFEVLCALLFQAGGLWLVGLTCYIGCGFLYLFLLPLIWQKLGLPSFLAYGALSLVLTPWWFNARPQLISYFFILSVIAILEIDRKKKSKLLLLLPVLMGVWANIHSFWSIGLITIFVYAGTAVFTKRPGSKRLVLLSLLSTLAIFVNPYGWLLPKHIISFADNEQWMGVWEVQPSYLSADFKYFFAYLCMFWMTFFKVRRGVAIEHFVMGAIASIASICVRRYESVAVLITWAYFGMALRQTSHVHTFMEQVLLSESESGQLFLVGNWASRTKRTLCAGIFCIFISVAFWTYQFPTQRQASAVFFNYGTESLNFFSEHFRGNQNFFSDPVTGSWLLLLGVTPVFIDTRYDMYPKQFCQQSIYCVAGLPGWDGFLTKNVIKTVILRNIAVGLTNKLRADRNWYVLLDDGVITIYVKSSMAAELTTHLHLTSHELEQSTSFSSETIRRTIQDRLKSP